MEKKLKLYESKLKPVGEMMRRKNEDLVVEKQKRLHLEADLDKYKSMFVELNEKFNTSSTIKSKLANSLYGT